MIVDELSRLKDYAGVCPALVSVAEFLENHDLDALPEGRMELPSCGGFVNLQAIPAKTQEQAVLESHRKMIDVQIPLTGDETMGYAPYGQLAATEYDGTKDIAFHGERPDSYVTVRRGMFAVFFPQDAHAPGITGKGLKKAVFKLPAAQGKLHG